MASMLSSLKALWIDGGLLRIPRGSENFGQSVYGGLIG